MICRHCPPDDQPIRKCYQHCAAAADGQHQPDLSTVHREPDAPVGAVDLNCARCGLSGCVLIDPADVQWE